LPFFGGLAIVASAPTGTTPAVKTDTSLNYTCSAIFAFSLFCSLFFAHMLSPLKFDRHNPETLFF
jgi:hypothetical protein